MTWTRLLFREPRIFTVILKFRRRFRRDFTGSIYSYLRENAISFYMYNELIYYSNSSFRFRIRFSPLSLLFLIVTPTTDHQLDRKNRKSENPFLSNQNKKSHT